MQLTLQVELDDDADDEELEEAVASLLAELAETPVDVRRAPDEESPPGAKGATRSAVNLLLLTGNTVALELAVDYVKDWLARRRRSRVQLTGPSGTEVVVTAIEVSTADARTLIAKLSGSALA